MKYNYFPNTGLKVSRISLGTMMFGGQTSEADSIDIIHCALDGGINFIDTADQYNRGASEIAVGKALAGRRDSVILAPLNRAPRVGDILLAEVETLCGNKTYVLHRLIRIEDETLVLQGDGNLAGEERCNAADVIGRVTRIESPKGRRKLLTRGRLWFALKPVRKYLLKIYRHTMI